MPATVKTGSKKGTKLSLTKRNNKDEPSSIQMNNDIRNLIKGKVDLNETCEFQEPLRFPGCGDNKVKAENGKKARAVAVATKVKGGSCEEREETVRCQVCNKNLSHMNVLRREQHVNKCIDKVEVVEKQQREEQQLLQAAKTAILDCPMCGQHFKAENARLVHLKKCSQNVGVSTEKMIQLVKDQEQERQQQLAAGIVPKELRSKVIKSAAPRKRRLKEPKSQFEEDVQVAMAMSSSLSSASDNVKDGKRKRNKKAVLEDVCLLTTLTEEDRQRRIGEKVNNILHMASHTKYNEVLLLLESSLKAESKQESGSLWKICSQDPVSCDNEKFYVGKLVPPLAVSKSEPGKNLRRLSSIPGREKSFAKRNDSILGQGSAGRSDTPADDIITASTQTAVVLAELAVDDADILDTSVGLQLTPDPQNTSHIADLQASGFCVEKMVLNKSEQDIQTAQAMLDYRGMINNKDYSDVTVISCNGQSFYAHQVILAARCPKLIQIMKDSVIRLEIPPDTVLSFLNYIYTGDVTLTSSSQSELLKLAKQLELSSLVDACNKVVLQTDMSGTGDQNDKTEVQEMEFVESKLDMKEIWGESDSDLDLDKGDQSCDGERDSVFNDDDYREISCTQNQKIRERLSQGADVVQHADSKHLSENNISQNFGIANDLSEVLYKLTDDHFAEAVKKPNIAERKELSPARDKSEELDNNYEDMEVDLDRRKDDNDEIMAVGLDSDFSSNRKRLKLSSEKENVRKREDSESNEKTFLKRTKLNSKPKESRDSSGCNHSVSQVYDVIDIDEEDVRNSSAGVNSSTADLFSSPSPRKSDLTSAETARDTSTVLSSKCLQSNSKFSTPFESKSDSKRTLNTSAFPVTPVVDIDSDSSAEDIAEVSERTGNSDDENQIKSVEQKDCVNGSLDESNDKIARNIENQKENNVVKSDKNEKDVSEVDRAKAELNFESSDDDLQITGDNFDELTQQSPTFNHLKTASVVSGTHNPEHKLDEIKYLGVKSSAEGFLDEKHSGDNNEYVENHLTVSTNVRHKHLFDTASDSEEIVTIQTEDSDMSDDNEREMTDTEAVADVADGKSNKKADVSGNGENASDLTRSVVRDGRKSMGYGKHELSVYSMDENNACTHISSYGASNADVWEDFDDCGMGYEPPDISAREASPTEGYEPTDKNTEENSALCGYELSGDCPGEMSPVIPKQDEVIDLSQNERDNNSGNQGDSDLDNVLLEDGDDSFVFKVNEQPEASKTPSANSLEMKKINFKTPTEFQTREKKKCKWLPPSPFTPMPQYGGMPTPALKKAVQQYGVKPVGKKRMIKVLEDIYHQTHQYETDSECELDDESNIGTAQKLSGGGTGLAGDSLPSSQGDMSSQDSDISDVLEESCMHTMSSDSDTQASPQKSVDVTRKLFAFIRANPEIHAKILMYEPLELDVLKKDIKDAGIKCSMDKLMDFLDERCIAFTSKNSRKRQNGRRGKQKSTKNKQIEK